MFDTCSSSRKFAPAVGKSESETGLKARLANSQDIRAVPGSTVHASASLHFATVLLVDSFAIKASNTLSIQRLDLRSSNPAATLSLEAEHLQLQEVTDCTMLTDCHLTASSSLRVSPPGLFCSPVSGLLSDNMSTSCRRCEDNTVQLDESGAGPCMTCPEGAADCRVDRLVLRKGFMVDARNVSHSLRCPNPSACPGGDARGPMCLAGHEGWAW